MVQVQISCDVERSRARPHGQAARSSGIAQLLMPLTPAARSLRRRAAHQSKDLEEAVLHVPNKLVNSKDQAHHTCSCSRSSLGCTPCRTADLADEHEHVERAGLGQVHHEGEVLDAQVSAPASSSLGDHARHPLIPPHWCSNKQMASKLSTGSSSNTAVGERTARTTIEHACSHRRHERRERRDQRHGWSARLGG